MEGAATLWSAWAILSPATLVIAVALAVYARGWRRLHAALPRRWSVRRAACFAAGAAALWIALQSPLDALSSWLLTAHMAQHFLLSMVAPPLLLLGWPQSPMLAGAPRWVSRDALGPLLAWPAAWRLGRALTHPVTGWIAMALATWIWHLPAMYQAALERPAWHAIEHLTFLWCGLLFWWSVVAPYPWRSPWPRIAMPLYLLSADGANTIVAAALAFAPGVVYPWYESTAPTFGVTALADQQAAAALMWIPGQLLYLVPAVAILYRSLSRPRPVTLALPVLRGAAPRAPRERFDLLRVPVIGAALSRRRLRGALRWCMLLGAAAVVADGWLGPREASTSLAGTWTWTHWRGAAAVGMIAAGNLACMACPLIAPRTLLRRWISPRFRWPRALRSKWIAAALVVAWLVAYEVWSLWDSALATAWIVVGYFAAATAIDLLFEGAAFCKWICPIGQYQMAMSVASPLEVAARSTEVCRACATHDCLRGNDRAPGCGTGLFMPGKIGNLDCTFCLDCVDACPHDNIGLRARTPCAELADDRPRAGVGVPSARGDLAALLLVLGAGAFANAMAMTQPLLEWVDALRDWSGSAALPAATAVAASMLAALLPPTVAALTAARSRGGILAALRGLALDLLPLAIAMWTAHFGFHLVTGFRSAWPPLQRALLDLGVRGLGTPQWAANCCAVTPQWLVPAQLCLLGAGVLASLSLVWSRAERGSHREGDGAAPPLSRVARGAAGGLLAALAWWALGAWIVLQPMQMRGLLSP
jgi:cytochrome c oxidase assembly factor CtaG